MANTWSGKFLVVAFVTLAVLSLAVVVGTLGGGVTELLYGAAGGIVVAIPIVGTYVVGTRRGQPHSHAVATATLVFGVVYMAAVIVRILTEFGA